MIAVAGRRRWLVLLIALVALWPAGSHAQTAPGAPLEILSIEYEPRSAQVAVQMRAGGSRDVPIEQLTVLVDAVPRTVVAELGFAALRPSVLLVIDTSGSMAGRPIAAASAAARGLVSQLSDDDPVGLITFADRPSLRLPIVANRQAVQTALGTLVAAGGTALFDAVILGLDTLAAVPEGPKALVLLSDGEDSGLSVLTRDEVLAAVDAGDVTVYSFALGATAPGEFLRELAARRGGAFWDVADEAALDELFVALGGRLGATRSVSVRVPGLAPGDHTVTLRARVAGVLTETSVPFSVVPALTLSVLPQPAPVAGDPFIFDLAIESSLPVEVRARLDGESPPVSVSGGRVRIDPWLVAPGGRVLTVTAIVGGVVVETAEVTVVIPALPPRLEVAPATGAEWRASARVQGGTAAIVLFSGGREVARTEDRALLFTPPAGEEIEVRLLGPSGEVLLAQPVLVPAAEGGRPAVLLLLVTIAVVAGVGSWLARASRRGRRAPVVRPLVRPLASPPEGAPAASAPRARARLEVTGPGGQVRHFALGGRPLRAGSRPGSDIPLTGAEIRPDHARFSLTSAGDLSVHGVGDRGARPYEGGTDDQWIVVRPGEEVAIGDWSFRLAAVEQGQEAS